MAGWSTAFRLAWLVAHALPWVLQIVSVSSMGWEWMNKITRTLALAALVLVHPALGWEAQDYQNEGRRQLAKGNYTIAKSYLAHAVRLSTRDLRSRTAYANALAALGEYAAALDQLQHAHKLNWDYCIKSQSGPVEFGGRKGFDALLRKLASALEERATQLVVRNLLTYYSYQCGDIPLASLHNDAARQLAQDDDFSKRYQDLLRAPVGQSSPIASQPPNMAERTEAADQSVLELSRRVAQQTKLDESERRRLYKELFSELYQATEQGMYGSNRVSPGDVEELIKQRQVKRTGFTRQILDDLYLEGGAKSWPDH